MAAETPIQLSPTELLVIASMEAEVVSRPHPAFTSSPPARETTPADRPTPSQEEQPDGKQLLVQARQLTEEEERDYQHSRPQYHAAEKILPAVQAINRLDRSGPMRWIDRKLGLIPPEQPVQGVGVPAPTEEELEAEVQARLAERKKLLLPELEEQLRPEIEAEIRRLLEEERAREGEARRTTPREQLTDLARQNPDAITDVLRGLIGGGEGMQHPRRPAIPTILTLQQEADERARQALEPIIKQRLEEEFDQERARLVRETEERVRQEIEEEDERHRFDQQQRSLPNRVRRGLSSLPSRLRRPPREALVDPVQQILANSPYPVFDLVEQLGLTSGDATARFDAWLDARVQSVMQEQRVTEEEAKQLVEEELDVRLPPQTQ